jgi:hypothetical protein
LGSERDSRGNRLFYRIVILNLFLHLRVYLLDELLCRDRLLMAISLVTVYGVSLLVSVAPKSGDVPMDLLVVDRIESGDTCTLGTSVGFVAEDMK